MPPRSLEVRPSPMRTTHLVQCARRAPTVYQDLAKAHQAFGPLVPQATQNRPKESKPCIRSKDPQTMRLVRRPGGRRPETKDSDVRAPSQSNCSQTSGAHRHPNLGRTPATTQGNRKQQPPLLCRKQQPPQLCQQDLKNSRHHSCKPKLQNCANKTTKISRHHSCKPKLQNLQQQPPQLREPNHKTSPLNRQSILACRTN